MFSDKRCEIKCVFPYVVGMRIMSMHISCDMYLLLGLYVQIRLYYELPYKEKISAQHEMGYILDRCIVFLGLIPQSQITNCRRTASFSGDFYTIVRRLHGYRPVAAQFERRQFKFQTPSDARSRFRKKL